MDKDKLYTAVLIRLISDTGEEGSLEDLLGNIKAIKGARRPTSLSNPAITINAPSTPRDPDYKTTNGTLLINIYADDYSSGNANVELLCPVADRIVQLFDDKPLEIEGYNNYNLVVLEPSGPLRDPSYPEEHFMSVRIRFNILPTA